LRSLRCHGLCSRRLHVLDPDRPVHMSTNSWRLVFHPPLGFHRLSTGSTIPPSAQCEPRATCRPAQPEPLVAPPTGASERTPPPSRRHGAQVHVLHLLPSRKPEQWGLIRRD
jgi:hypothetical protein